MSKTVLNNKINVNGVDTTYYCLGRLRPTDYTFKLAPLRWRTSVRMFPSCLGLRPNLCPLCSAWGPSILFFLSLTPFFTHHSIVSFLLLLLDSLPRTWRSTVCSRSICFLLSSFIPLRIDKMPRPFSLSFSLNPPGTVYATRPPQNAMLLRGWSPWLWSLSPVYSHACLSADDFTREREKAKSPSILLAARFTTLTINLYRCVLLHLLHNTCWDFTSV